MTNIFYIVPFAIEHDESMLCFQYEYEQERTFSINFCRSRSMCPKCKMFLYGIRSIALDKKVFVNHYSGSRGTISKYCFTSTTFTNRFERRYQEVTNRNIERMKEDLTDTDMNIIPRIDYKGYKQIQKCVDWLEKYMNDTNVRIIYQWKWL
jgi:hypothetical protein